MKLKGKTGSGFLYRVPGSKDYLLSTRQDREDLFKALNSPVIAYRRMEDEEGKIQLVQQTMGYFIVDNKTEKLKPNQEKVADLTDGMIVRYVQDQTAYKDNKPDGPSIEFDKDGNVLAVRHFRNGIRDGMTVTRQKDGKWEYELYEKGKRIKDHKTLLQEWAEKREAVKFEKLVKSGAIKGLKSLKEVQSTQKPTDKTR